MSNLNVRKRGEKWEYRFEGAKIDGKRKQYSKGGFRTKKDALDAGTAALAAYNQGETVFRPSEKSLYDYLNEWFDLYVTVNLRPKTQDSYNTIIQNHVKPNIGHYPLSSVTPALLQSFANTLKSKGYSRRHIVNILSLLNGALKYAVEPLRYIKNNPMAYVKPPTIERAPRQRIVLSSDDWQRIISRFPFGNKYHIPLIVGYHTGMRISEVFALTWSDIDLKRGEIHVNKQVIKYKPDKNKKALWCFAPTKTKASVRTVKIGATLIKILKAEKARQNKNRLLYGEYFTRHNLAPLTETITHFEPDTNGSIELVCICDDGNFVTTDSFKYCSRVIHHELKIEFDFHSLRHTHATILVENGADIKNVQKRLGHEKIETTLQTYVHDTEQMANNSVDIFERVLPTASAHGGQ